MKSAHAQSEGRRERPWRGRRLIGGAGTHRPGTQAACPFSTGTHLEGVLERRNVPLRNRSKALCRRPFCFCCTAHPRTRNCKRKKRLVRPPSTRASARDGRRRQGRACAVLHRGAARGALRPVVPAFSGPVAASANFFRAFLDRAAPMRRSLLIRIALSGTVFRMSSVR